MTTRSSAGAASELRQRASTATRCGPSHGHFVKASGLRWLSLMLLAPVPWAQRVWALPFLTALASSERYCETRGRRHKKLTDWGRQLVAQARRWLPGRELVVVADSAFAALEFLAAASRCGVACITRLRLDAALYDPAPPRLPGAIGRPRTKGKRLPILAAVLADPATAWQRVTVPGWYGGGERDADPATAWQRVTVPGWYGGGERDADPATAWQRVTVPGWYGGGERDIEISTGTAVWRHSGMPIVPIRWVLIRDPAGQFDPQALLCTDPAQDPVQVLCWFAQRWQVEVTFREVRDHLGVETQRQWSDLAIARTTPCLLGLFSLVTLLGKQLTPHARRATSTSAWYRKQHPTFSDTLAAVRREIWREQGFITSSRAGNMKKLRPALRNGITYALCHAA